MIAIEECPNCGDLENQRDRLEERIAELEKWLAEERRTSNQFEEYLVERDARIAELEAQAEQWRRAAEENSWPFEWVIATEYKTRAESAEAERDRLRGVVEWVLKEVQETIVAKQGYATATIEDYFRDYKGIHLRMYAEDVAKLQAALSEARQPHTHYCQEHADTWTCNDVTCEAGDVRGCPRKPESEGKNVG